MEELLATLLLVDAALVGRLLLQKMLQSQEAR